ncbi:MAG TPA: serine/threonine-protein kinase, partial [Verrucomicrobiae bacterium]
MKTNESTNACPKCGAPVPPEAPQGLCPQCVFAQAAAPAAAPTATSQIPSLERLAVAFPQLQIFELVGRGGMGFVFKARQPHLDRFVALKLLPDSLAHDPQFAERFNREGRVLARLNHPNIVSIFDFGQAGGFYYLMMEYVDGVNLRQAMQAGRFSPAEALTIVPKICEALQFAHEEGILHRDIKPENILLDARGRVKIADFGIAKLVGEEHPEVSLTATGAALGTMHYMAPEQIEKPSTVDHRADIYSLGVVFYELLTGELPIGRFSPPSQRTPLDPRVDDVVMRTLEKEREKRFQSAGEMGTNVEHLTDSGAGKFSAPPPRIPGVDEHAPGGTVVIKPKDVLNLPQWSLQAVGGAVLVGISFVPVVVLLSFVAYFAAGRRNFAGTQAPVLISGSLLFCLPAIAGTILGWMGLSDISRGEKRGAAFAIFAALFWPVILLATFTVWLVVAPIRNFAEMAPFASLLLLLVPAGTVTFIIWAIYTAVHKATRQPTPQRRGVLKWVFAALLVSGIGFVMVPRPARTSSPTRTHIDNTRRAMGPRQATPAPIAVADTNTTPWIRFTFTAVELREAQGVRWLVIDYLDDVHGECQKAFTCGSSIPGFKATTRTSEFLGGDTNAPVR